MYVYKIYMCVYSGSQVVLSLLYLSITFGRIDVSFLLETLSLGFQNILLLFSSYFTSGSSYSFFYLVGV